MIQDGRVLDSFSSKEKVASFPVMNNTNVLQCKWNSVPAATYVLIVKSSSLSVMQDPSLDIMKTGLTTTAPSNFTMDFTCLVSEKVFLSVDVHLNFAETDSVKNYRFYLSKNCSIPVIPANDSQNSIILYIVCIVLAVVLVLVILISVVCYVRVRRRSGNQKPINMVALPPGNGYTPIPEHSALYSDYTQYPAPQLTSPPSMQSAMPPSKHPGYAYSSGDGSFMSEPMHHKMGNMTPMQNMPPPSYHSAYGSERLPRTPNGMTPVNMHPDPLSNVEIHIPRTSVQLEKGVFSGMIGAQYLATFTRDAGLNQLSMVVAKTLKEEASSPDQVQKFIREAVILEHVKHQNILSVIGIVDDGGIPPIAIYPYMKGGNLHRFLHLARPKAGGSPTLTVSDQIHMMIGVARGMEALSRKNVHGDLAARNCVVGNDLLVKVADSALSRDFFPTDYHPHEKGPTLPVKWMAAETLTDLLYSTMSDVWSFGVTFWEVLTLGDHPYVDVAPNSMVQHLRGGYRLMQPEVCTDELFSLLVRCWALNPDDRMSFGQILAQLETIQCKAAMGAYHPSSLESILTPDRLGQLETIQKLSDKPTTPTVRTDDGQIQV